MDDGGAGITEDLTQGTDARISKEELGLDQSSQGEAGRPRNGAWIVLRRRLSHINSAQGNVENQLTHSHASGRVHTEILRVAREEQHRRGWSTGHILTFYIGK